MTSSWGFSQTWDRLRSPTLWTDSLLTEPPRKPQNTPVGSLSLFQGNRPDPGIEPQSPALQADSLPAELPGKPSHASLTI